MSGSGGRGSTGGVGGRGGTATWLRPLLGASLLACVVWRVGWDPFVEGVRRVEPSSLVAAAAIAAATTVCCAWRWSLVARALGIPVPLAHAVSACYRSQFVNGTTPVGVVGDVLRGVATGRNGGDLMLGVRSVVWERFLGQAVQVLVAVVVLSAFPAPVPRTVVWGGVLVLAAAAAVVAMLRPRAVARVRARVLGEAGLLLARTLWPRLLVASTLAVGGHVATFLLAARSAGSSAPTVRLVPVALLVLLTAGLPLNVAGWGPREGAAAWAFGAAGLGASLGLSTAVAFGLLGLVSSLPGAVLLAWAGVRRPRGAGRRQPAASLREPAQVGGPARA